jgi:hypothetical protein
MDAETSQVLWQIKTCRSRKIATAVAGAPHRNTVDWSEVCQLTLNLILVGGRTVAKKKRNNLWFVFIQIDTLPGVDFLPFDKPFRRAMLLLCTLNVTTMMANLPIYIPLVFGLTTLLAVWFFYKAAHYSNKVLGAMLAWILLQGIVGLSGFYTVTTSTPPRLLLLVLPPLLLVVLLFNTVKGKLWINSLDKGILTLLHVVRIPVELVLYALCLHKAVPQIMTFEGHNWDILSGITAPFIYYFGYVKNKIPVRWMLLWNLICLLLLFNIVIHAILSAPFPFQQLGFEQPNMAILHFPFVWLPGFVVPVVLLAHLASIRQLLQKNK